MQNSIDVYRLELIFSNESARVLTVIVISLCRRCSVKIQIKYFILILLFSSCVYSKNSDPDMTTLQNAVNGDVKSEIEIGLEYIRNGEDVKKQAEGVEWIRKAAEKNSVITSYSIHYTKLYEFGFCLPLQ